MGFIAKNIVFLLVIVCWGEGYAQKNKFDLYLSKAVEFKNENFVKAKLYIDSAKTVAKHQNDKLLLAEAYNADCVVLTANARYNDAYEQLEKANFYAQNAGDKILLSDIYNNYGIYYEKKSEYSKSIFYHLKGLKIRQELKKPKLICASYQNIGALYFYLGDFNQSEKYTNLALEIAQDLKDEKVIGELFANFGAIYFSNYKDSLAQIYMLKALDVAVEQNYKIGIESACTNLSAFYVDTDRPLIAKQYLERAIALLNDNPDRACSIMQNLGKVYEKLKKPDSAVYYYNKSLKLAELVGNKHMIYNVYKDLNTFYYAQKNYAEAYSYLDKFYLLKDSLSNEANMKNIAELESIYRTEKQSKEIEFLNTQNKIEKENTKNKKFLLWASLVALVLAVFAAVAFYLNFRNKKRDNVILQDKNIEIQKQKELVAEKNKEIIDSITYAKRLQDAILPSVEHIQKQLPQSFVLYKPKDIVAGDFYWMHVISKRSDEKSVLIAVADCTGHGVPGAMVSVVCANALNAAVKEFGLTEPAKILDKVNELVEETFGKSESEVKDGMDISLLKIEFVNDHPDNKVPKGKLIIPKGQSLADVVEANKKFNVQWAGANNPLWYIKNGEWCEIKADKQPVGKFENRKPFTNHSVQLKVTDSLFLISDGYADQFGGEQGKKMKNKFLKELLFKNSSQNCNSQKQILENEFESWKGQHEQVDDVCIIGIKL